MGWLGVSGGGGATDFFAARPSEGSDLCPLPHLQETDDGTYLVPWIKDVSEEKDDRCWIAVGRFLGVAIMQGMGAGVEVTKPAQSSSHPWSLGSRSDGCYSAGTEVYWEARAVG